MAATLAALAAALEAKDKYTASHADTIATMAVAIGRRLGLSDQALRRVEYVALLHDVGKIGPLSAEERAVVNEHTQIGERIVARIDYLRSLAPLVHAAHERWDGTGYPDEFAGEDIPPARGAHRLRLRCLRRNDLRPFLPSAAQ